MTPYVVLVEHPREEGHWTVRVLEVEARSAEQAVRLAAAEIGAGQYVAVPARSWQPVTVKVETQTRMVLT